MAQTNYTTLSEATSNWTGLSGLNNVGANRQIRLDTQASFTITDLDNNILLGINQTAQVLQFGSNTKNPLPVAGGMYFNGTDFYLGV
tara:strand:- start:31 stop:291 length:261 start_codon:yes stop_codon:yes gene_type:complete